MPGIAAITGHRPPKLGGYRIPNPIFNSVMEGLDKKFMELSPDLVITGMAVGVDQWAAELCIFNGIPFVAAIPCEAHESKWPVYAQAKYYELLAQAFQVVLVNSGTYEPWKMQTRNEWMIDNCNYVVAVFDGTPGGTANCISYAVPRKPVHYCEYIHPLPVVQLEPLVPTRGQEADIRERQERRAREEEERRQRTAERLREIERQRQEESEGNRRAREEAQRAAAEEVERERLAERRRVEEPVVEVEEEKDPTAHVVTFQRRVDF